MKKILGVLLLLIALCLNCSISAWADAAEAQFKLSLTGTTLVVSDNKGVNVATLYLPTIGKEIDLDTVSFLISYGLDARGNYSAIVTPNPDKPADLTFEAFGHQLTIEKNGMVTATAVQGSRKLTFDPGFVGQVKLDNKIIATSTSTGGVSSSQPLGSPATEIAEAKPTAPTSEPSSVTGETTMAPESVAPQDAVSATPSAGMQTVQLASDFSAQNPGVNLVPLGPSQTANTEEIEQMKARGEVAQKQFFWAEPVTPPDASEAMQVAANEIKLTEVIGEVKATNAQGNPVTVKNGQTVESNSKFIAGPNSSVALLLGGVDSIRLTPNTKATISSVLTGDTRVTTVTLLEGTVFNKVGKREGEKQDFKVLTTSGSAEVHGTDFSSTFQEGRLVTFCVQGAVAVFDASHQLIGTAAPRQGHSLAYLSVGGTSSSTSPLQQSQDLLSILATAAEVNAKLNSLIAQQTGGEPLNPVQERYLQNASVVEVAIAPIPQNDVLLNTFQLPTPLEIVSLPQLTASNDIIPITAVNAQQTQSRFLPDDLSPAQPTIIPPNLNPIVQVKPTTPPTTTPPTTTPPPTTPF